MVEEKKIKQRTKEEERKEEGNSFEIEGKCHNEKEKKKPTSMFGLVQVKWFGFIPKQPHPWFRLNGLGSSQTASSTTGASVGAGSQQPNFVVREETKIKTIKKRVSLCAAINPKRFRNVFMIFVNLQLRTQLWNTIDLGIWPSAVYLFSKWTLPYILKSKLLIDIWLFCQVHLPKL
jgi:hypothetical protein